MHYEIKNITDIDGFFKVIDSCQGKVELITGEGDRLNLKSKLCQYVSLTSILKTDVEIPELELVAYEPEDTEKIIKFLMRAGGTVNTGWRFFFGLRAMGAL
ncbi:MAG: polya polymerase [Roseburia hominis]